MSKRSDQVNLELLKFPLARRQEIWDNAIKIAKLDGREEVRVGDIRAAAILADKRFFGGEPVDV